MNIIPLHDRVLVERIEAESKTAGGLLLPDNAKEERSEGKVIAIGQGLRAKDGARIALDVKKGDHIVFAKWGGNEMKADGKKLILLKESDILGIIK